MVEVDAARSRLKHVKTSQDNRTGVTYQKHPETLPPPRLFSPHPQPSKTAILKRTRHVDGKDWSMKPSMFLSLSPKEPTAMRSTTDSHSRFLGLEADVTASLQLAGDVNMPVPADVGEYYEL